MELPTVSPPLSLTSLPKQQLDDAINGYVETYNQHYLQNMRKKIGLLETLDDDRELVADMLILMDQSDCDFQHFFLNLAKVESSENAQQALKDCLASEMVPDSKAWRIWLERYFHFVVNLNSNPNSAPLLLNNIRQKFILRKLHQPTGY